MAHANGSNGNQRGSKSKPRTSGTGSTSILCFNFSDLNYKLIKNIKCKVKSKMQSDSSFIFISFTPLQLPGILLGGNDTAPMSQDDRRAAQAAAAEARAKA